MSAAGEAAAAVPPKRHGRWLKIALVVSLAINLVVAGGAVTRLVVGPPPERAPGTSQMQLIPRKFFGDLDRERRLALLRAFRSYEPAFREGRRQARAEILNLAAVLEAEPYDPARTAAAVEAFSARGAVLAGTGTAAALAIIGQLTPEERKILARSIRQREERGRNRPGPPPPGDGPDGAP